MIGWFGARLALLCHAEGTFGIAEQAGCEDGIIAYKIAAHAADLAKGTPPRNSGTIRYQGPFEFHGKISSI